MSSSNNTSKHIKLQHKAQEIPVNLTQTWKTTHQRDLSSHSLTRTVFDGVFKPETGDLWRVTPLLNHHLNKGVKAKTCHIPASFSLCTSWNDAWLLFHTQQDKGLKGKKSQLSDTAEHCPRRHCSPRTAVNFMEFISLWPHWLGCDGMCSSSSRLWSWDTLKLNSSSKMIHLLSTLTERNRCRRRGSSLRLFLCVQLVDSAESVKEAQQAAAHAHTCTDTHAHTLMQLTKGCSRKLIKAVPDGHAGKVRLEKHKNTHTQTNKTCMFPETLNSPNNCP